MRTIIYTVWDKESNKKVYVNCYRRECEKFINSQENPASFGITYKWRSF